MAHWCVHQSKRANRYRVMALEVMGLERAALNLNFSAVSTDLKTARHLILCCAWQTEIMAL
jgi:hypothetical protein